MQELGLPGSHLPRPLVALAQYKGQHNARHRGQRAQRGTDEDAFAVLLKQADLWLGPSLLGL